MSLVYSAIAIGATIAMWVLTSKGQDIFASYCFTLAVWAWGKADYYSLKDEMRGR